MLTGVTRPFHAPHALFTPSARRSKTGRDLFAEVRNAFIHGLILRS